MSSRLSIALACAAAFSVPAVAQQPQTPQTLKVAYIDPLSGPFASVGELMLNHLRFGIDDVKRRVAC